jgi:hypothetical protein
MGSNLYSTAGMVIDLSIPHTYISTAGTALRRDVLLLNYLFNADYKLKERNKKLFLFLDSNLKEGKLDIVRDFVNDKAIANLDVSLLKSALIMTESREDIDTQYLNSIYQEKISG